MDIDVRLDRLTERHEALTLTVELTAAMQQENEKQIGKIAEKLDIPTDRTIQAMDAINSLVRIAESHISDMEEGK
jgi:hypothetical protein